MVISSSSLLFQAFNRSQASHSEENDAWRAPHRFRSPSWCSVGVANLQLLRNLLKGMQDGRMVFEMVLELPD